jgi:UDP-glucuronate 4-epimerase
LPDFISGMKILITGTAGFIGFHTALKMIRAGHEVVGLDSINDYYDVRLKYGRLTECGIERDTITYGRKVKSSRFDNYSFMQAKLEDRDAIKKLFEQEQFTHVINLAAQAGVRYSLENPHAYTESNVSGFINILEGCRHTGVQHLVYASTSSVYGLNEKMPLSPHDPTEHPMTLYAATKKANEMMAHSYSHLFKLPTTGLRFFTVYGPWGRPDMALFLFTEAILKDEPIKLFNNGEMVRDFTYVDDIAEGVVRCALKPAQSNALWNPQQPDIATSSAPYQIFNIGNAQPVRLIEYVKAIEKHLGKSARKEMLPMQLGDVPATHADVDDLVRYIDYKPATSIEAGVGKFIEWYRSFYG